MTTKSTLDIKKKTPNGSVSRLYLKKEISYKQANINVTVIRNGMNRKIHFMAERNTKHRRYHKIDESSGMICSLIKAKIKI